MTDNIYTYVFTKFLLIECWVDKRTEMEAGLMHGILARYMFN